MPLELDLERDATPPRPAATMIVLRDGAAGLEVFAVERNKKSRFLGGALVFPGGKVDAEDANDAWAPLVSEVHRRAAELGGDARAFAVAACREALEEAAILPVLGGALGHEDALELRRRVSEGSVSLRAVLEERRLQLDLASLVPFARWVTPTAEHRRFDARFYLTRAPAGQEGAHDDYETKSSFWARPSEILARFERGELEVYPPTHRTLEQLTEFARAEDALAWAEREANLAPICPELVPHTDANGQTLALTLPGDPDHSVKALRVPGRTRFVLRGTQWLPE